VQVFVAGATGFIGNATCRALVAAGHEVTGLARSAEKAARLERQGVRPVVGKLDDAASLVKEAGRPEAVIHLAAPRFAGRETMEESERIGALMLDWTRMLACRALETSVRIFVFGGTFQIHGDEAEAPTRGASARTPYGYDRFLYPSQSHLENAARRDGLPLIVLVPGWVYGPGQWFAELVREIPTGRTSHLVGDGAAHIGYVEVDDVGEAFRLAAERDRPRGFYNITDDDPCSVRQFVERTAQAIGAPMPRGLDSSQARAQYGEIHVEARTISERLDNSSARDALGWRPRYATTRDGIPATLARMGFMR
jgi:nucleoside-diphosphate-sugar epimerase